MLRQPDGVVNAGNLACVKTWSFATQIAQETGRLLHCSGQESHIEEDAAETLRTYERRSAAASHLLLRGLFRRPPPGRPKAAA
jgi:hypothetical protein